VYYLPDLSFGIGPSPQTRQGRRTPVSETKSSGWQTFGAIVVLLFCIGAIGSLVDYLKSPSGAPILNAVEILLLGGVCMGAIYWQIALIRDDEGIPSRLVVPLCLCFAMLVGDLVRGVMRMHDGHIYGYGLKGLSIELFAITMITLILSLKTYLGPIFLAGTLIQLIYNGFELKELLAMKWASALLQLLLPGTPEELQAIYIVVSVTTVFGACTWDSIHHAF
jgi:hypothetical protein